MSNVKLDWSHPKSSNVRGAPSPPSHPLCINQTWHPSRGSPLSLGCAFRFVFRFLPGLIFRNSGNSAEFPEFRGTHVGIKSFQGKINLFRNPTESGIPAGILEGRTLDMVFCATCNEHSLRRHKKNRCQRWHSAVSWAAAATVHRHKPLLLPPLLPLLSRGSSGGAGVAACGGSSGGGGGGGSGSGSGAIL